jgi:uncharacterized protein YegL
MGSKDASVINGALQDAQDDDILSPDARDLMAVNLTNQVMIGAGGMDIDDIETTEVTLVTLVVDDSTSMSGEVQNVCIGQNEMLDAIGGSKQNEQFLIGMWALNRRDPYHGYVQVKDALRLDNKSYRTQGMTPLYSRWLEAATANVVYAQQLRATGTPVRSILVVLTDGENNQSGRIRAADCAKVAKDLLASEQFILAFIGVGREANFKAVAKRMGIPDGAVLLANETGRDSGDRESEIRQVFQILSQSVIRASQTTIDPQAQNNFFNSGS